MLHKEYFPDFPLLSAYQLINLGPRAYQRIYQTFAMVSYQCNELVVMLYSHEVSRFLRVPLSLPLVMASILSSLQLPLSLKRLSALSLRCVTVVDRSSVSHPYLLSQVIVAIFDVITDILCCRCCGRRRTRTSTRTGGRRFRRRGVRTAY